MGEKFIQSIPFKDITTDDVADICTGLCDYNGLAKIAVKFSDGLILDDNKVSKEITNYAKEIGKPILKAQDEDTYAQAYSDFYDSLMD